MKSVAPAGRQRTPSSRWRARVGPACLALALSVAAPGATAGDPAEERGRRFAEAGQAYREGRAPDAVRLYEEVIRDAPTAMEALYNLGNAHLRSGRIGPAVLSYRRAWRLAPRDPDIGTNLRLALGTTGASESDLSGPEILFTRLSRAEWSAVAVAAWWSACVLIAGALLATTRRRSLVPAAAAATLVAVAACAGIWTWRGFEREPELVVLDGGQTALVAPELAASPAFPLPEGSVVRAKAHRGEWVEVRSGQLTGWVRRAACAAVLPAAPDQD